MARQNKSWPALALCLVLMLPSAASAGSITLSVTTAQGTVNRSVSPSDADIDRLRAAYAVTCQRSDPEVPCTTGEVASHMATAIFRLLRDTTIALESKAAREAASDAVVAIDGIP